MPLNHIPDQHRRIFAFTGFPGVGKSYVAKSFAGMGEYPVVNMGEEMKQQYESMPFGNDHAQTPTGTWEMAQSLRAEHGPRGPAYASLSRISAGFVESNVVVVDGVRSVEETDCFKEVFECPVHLVAVTADEQTRLERFAERAGYYDAFEDFEEPDTVAEAIAEYEMTSRTRRESAEGLADAIEYANYSIENSGTKKETDLQAARLADDFDPLL